MRAMTWKTRLIMAVDITVAIAIIVIAGLTWYDRTHLLVVSTTPAAGTTASAATPINVTFNKPISHDPAVLSISPHVDGRVTISGTRLNFSPSALLADDRTYTVTLQHVTTADGRYSGTFTIAFTTGFVPWDQQSKQTQDRALIFVDNHTPQLAFLGEDLLITQGVTDEQIPYIEAPLRKLFDATPKRDYAINIDNVVAAPFDADADTGQKLTFDVQINDVTYDAVLTSRPFGPLRLQLFHAGRLVEDTGEVHPQ